MVQNSGADDVEGMTDAAMHHPVDGRMTGMSRPHTRCRSNTGLAGVRLADVWEF
jgi:hypothetical protein